MFAIDIIGDQADMRVFFKHYYPLSTVCTLSLPPGMEFNKTRGSRLEAIARCHPGDSWDKAIGRKIALSKVLRKAGIDKETRTKVWNRYFETRGKVN